MYSILDIKGIILVHNQYNSILNLVLQLQMLCHALVLTRKVISVNSDGNKMVDIISYII